MSEIYGYRIEELSEPKRADRHYRYTAYLSESLETLYFMVNLKNLKIYHTGRLPYTSLQFRLPNPQVLDRELLKILRCCA